MSSGAANNSCVSFMIHDFTFMSSFLIAFQRFPPAQNSVTSS